MWTSTLTKRTYTVNTPNTLTAQQLRQNTVHERLFKTTYLQIQLGGAKIKPKSYTGQAISI